MINLRDKVKSFLRKYDINIRDTSRRVATPRPMNHYFVDANDKGMIETRGVERMEEPLITVELPLSRLEALAELESVFYNNIEDSSSRRIFETWLDQHHQERALRAKYDAVRIAYEHYSAIIAWCNSGKNPLDFKGLDNS